MKYTNKNEVMWDVERNENTIFEMVVSKIVGSIIPKEDKGVIGDVSLAETFKALAEVDSYDEFISKYQESANGYATFIIALVENINDINIFKFESLEDGECVLEANNTPHLIHHEVIPSLDDELVAFELTKNLQSKIADVIKDDLQKTAEKEDALEKIKDDLDDIDGENEDDEDNKEENDYEEDKDISSETDDTEDEKNNMPEEVKQDLAEAYGAPNADMVKFMLQKQDRFAKKDIDHIIDTYFNIKDKAVSTKLSLLLDTAFSSIKKNINDTLDRNKDGRYNTPEEAIEIVDLALSGKLGIIVKPLYDYMYDELTGMVLVYAVAFVSTLLLGWIGACIGMYFAIYVVYKNLFKFIGGIYRCRGIVKDAIRSIDKEIDELEGSKANAVRVADLKKVRAELAKNTHLKEYEIYSLSESIAFDEPEVSYSIDMRRITENMVGNLVERNSLDADPRVLEAAIVSTASTIVLIEMLGLKTHEEMLDLLETE